MVCNRLEVICHEDIDTIAAPHVFPFVAASLAASRERYTKSIGGARLMVGNAIRMMHARRSRARAFTSQPPSCLTYIKAVTRLPPTMAYDLDWSGDRHAPEPWTSS
jgi:hypothetical protein